MDSCRTSSLFNNSEDVHFFSQRELIIWTFRPKNSSYMYIYILIIALNFREETRMACYCLKGENNLDMPSKNMS